MGGKGPHNNRRTDTKELKGCPCEDCENVKRCSEEEMVCSEYRYWLNRDSQKGEPTYTVNREPSKKEWKKVYG